MTSSLLPPPREYHSNREAPDQFRTDEIARLEQESASFSYAVDVRYGLMPNENTPCRYRPGRDIQTNSRSCPDQARAGWAHHLLIKVGPYCRVRNSLPPIKPVEITYCSTEKLANITSSTPQKDRTNQPGSSAMSLNRNQFESAPSTHSVDSVADRIAEITAQKPILNVVDQPLPSLQRLADLIDGREQLRQWQTALRESDNNAISNFANHTEGVFQSNTITTNFVNPIEYKTEFPAV
ncbi:MAG: hypothetical protein R3D26_10710 [Cyanobacteriota/Melainabacteria group bacterium]